MMLYHGEQYGADGIELSAHALSAPDHLPVQGRQFSNAEFNNMQNGLACTDVNGNVYDGFERPIGEWNCKHFAFPIVIGVSEPTYTDEQLRDMQKNSAEKYDATQKMRQLETNLRKLKERRMAFSSAGNELDAVRTQREINLKTKEYKQFCADNGLTPQNERANVDGYRRISVSSNALTNGENKNIIETYKGKTLSINNNVQISQEVISKVEDAVKFVQKDFKHLFEFSEGIDFGNIFDDLGCAKFDVRTGKANIELNINGFANPVKLLEILNNDFKSGQSYEVEGIESLVAHEMGHNIHYALSLKRANIPYGKPLNNLSLYLFDKEYKKICQEIYLQYFSNETIEQINKLCINELGYLTKNNPIELIAQSFGNYYYGKEKSKIAKSIVKYFIKEMK